MNFETFDNDTCTNDAEYAAFVEWLSALTATELREARHEPMRQREALTRYYARGYRAHLTPGELVDFLGVSTPSIVERAGYRGAEGDALMRLAESVTDAEVQAVSAARAV